MRQSPLTLRPVIDPAENNFALLRLAAAVSVVVSHAFYLGTGDVLAQPLSGVTRYNLGQHAVNVFFILSGVMVAGSLDRSATLLDFATARILRIFPGLVLCILVLACVFGPLMTTMAALDYFRDARVYRYILAALGLKASAALPGVLEHAPVPHRLNEPLWTLKFEILCYAFLAFASAIGAWKSNRAFLGLVAISLLACVPITLQPLPPSLSDLPFSAHVARFWLCFLLGVTFYRLRDRLVLSWPALGLIAVLWAWFGRGTSLEPILSFLLVGYGSLLLAALPGGALRTWSNRTDISYGIYIYGWPATQALVWAQPALGLPVLITASVGIAAGLGLLSWKICEQPSLKARNSIACRMNQLVRGSHPATAAVAPGVTHAPESNSRHVRQTMP